MGNRRALGMAFLGVGAALAGTAPLASQPGARTGPTGPTGPTCPTCPTGPTLARGGALRAAGRAEKAEKH